MNVENLSRDSNNWLGVLWRYFNWVCFKKVLNVVAVVVGLFFAGLVYLQYQQIIDIKWPKFQAASQNAIATLANAMTQIPGFNTGNHADALPMTNFGITLTGSMSMGFAIGFMRG